MKTNKTEKLFRIAREEKPPAASEDFAARVMQQIRRAEAIPPVSFLDQVNALFPRIALCAGMAIVLCLALDFVATEFGAVDLNDQLAQVSSEWLLP
jgi:hypothetical protein